MKLRSAPPLEGLQWARAGLLQLLRQPLQHAAMFGLMAFSLALLLSLPWIGPMIALALLPALNAGWVHASDCVQRGESITPLRLLVPLRSARRNQLLQLGALHAFAALLMFGLAGLLDPEFADQWNLAITGSQADDEITARAVAAVQQGMLLRALLMVPVMLLFWHAPTIIHRTGASVGKALFGSAMATLRNLGGLAVYLLAWIGADVLLSAVIGGLLGLIGQSALSVLVVVLGSMLFSAAFFASIRACVYGCIEFDDTP